MKINYLKLKNIGPYVGVQYFDLNTNPLKNINLIGGKNGAGKTTFLKAIKYGLFGSFSLGFKNDTAVYLNEINTILNNRCKSGFFIEIGFEYVENFETFKYVLKRSWTKTKTNLSESLKIFKNGNELSDFETKEVNDKIHAITSPQLINSFIFDGEKIGNVIENGEIPNYLEEVFNSVFSINLIRQTENDLNSYLSKRANDIQSKDMIENVSLISKINSLKNQIYSTEKTITGLKKSINDLSQQKKSNMDNFYKLGGLTKNEQDEYNKKINVYALEREKNNKLIRSFIESDLPIYICYDLLEDSLIQARVEHQKQYLFYLEEIEKFLKRDLKEVKKDIESKIEVDSPVFHFLSDDDYHRLENKIADVAFSVEKIRPLLSNKHMKYDEYRMLKKGIENNQNIATIDEIIKANRLIDDSIATLNEELKESENNLSSLKSELSLTLDMYTRSSDIIKKDALYDSSFSLGKNVLDLCYKFEDELKKHKLSLVAKNALEIFCDTIRKHDFITEMRINNDYSLDLINSKNVLIDPRTLSAGEMQILVSSIIWSMFRISGRREMFIFDTPLARLDSENRQNFISKIISTISSQVVILSTDSEFVGDNYNLIANRIYKQYLLEYDESSNKTTISERYFRGV